MSSCIPLDFPASTPTAYATVPNKSLASLAAKPFVPSVRDARPGDHKVSAMAPYHHFLTAVEAARHPTLRDVYRRHGLAQFGGLSIRNRYLESGTTVPPLHSSAAYTAAFKVQNLPMFQGPNRTASSPADYIRYFESVLRQMLPLAKVVYIHTVYKLDYWVEFVVVSDVSLDAFSTYNMTYPVLMDRDGFHTAMCDDGDMYNYAYHVATPKANPYTRMSKDDRHYLCGGMPSNLLKIQRL